METSGVALGARVRVFVSYAHDTPEHVEAVARLSDLLRRNGIEVHRDGPASTERLDWAMWMTAQLRAADYVLVVASPDYRLFAEDQAETGRRRGVQWEARLIREEYYRDYAQARRKYLPVLLPGGSVDDIPMFLGPYSTMHFAVPALTFAGIEELYRILTGQAAETAEPVGTVRRLPARSPAPSAESPGNGSTTGEPPDVISLNAASGPSASAAQAPARRRFLLAAAGAAVTLPGLVADSIAGRGLEPSVSAAVLADRVAARADAQRSKNADLAVRLDLAAFQIHPTPKATTNLMKHAYLRSLLGHTQQVQSVFFHPHQNILVSGGADAHIHVWHLDSPGSGEILSPGHSDTIFSVAIDPSGKFLASGGKDAVTMVWNWGDQGPVQPHWLYGNTESVFRLGFSPIANLLAVGGTDGRVFLWDPKKLTQSASALNNSGPYRVRKWVWSLAFHPAKELLATAGDGEEASVIRLWNLASSAHSHVDLLGRFSTVGALAFNPKYPDQLVSADFTGRICYTDSANPDQPATFYDGDTTQPSKCLSFSPDGGSFAVGGVDRIVRIWAADNPVVPTKLVGHTDTVNCIAYHPSSQILATGGDDATIRLWQASPAAVRQRLCQEGMTLSSDDWPRYIPEIPYFSVCRNA